MGPGMMVAMVGAMMVATVEAMAGVMMGGMVGAMHIYDHDGAPGNESSQRWVSRAVSDLPRAN